MNNTNNKTKGAIAMTDFYGQLNSVADKAREITKEIGSASQRSRRWSGLVNFQHSGISKANNTGL